MIRFSLASAVLCAVIALVPSTASSQNAEQSTVVTAAAPHTDALTVKQVGLSRAALREHTRAAETVAGTTTALTQTRTRRGQTWMIVGGAAFLAGLIIGDDVGTALAVGGAAIGIYGLYLWAQ